MAKAHKDLADQLEGQLWGPTIGWHILKRSRRYHAAVKRFMEQAEGPLKGLTDQVPMLQ